MVNGFLLKMDTLAVRNNNPGNLKDPSTGVFKTFKTPQEGYAALLNDLHAKITGTSTTGLNSASTLADFAKVYAPPSDNNDTAQYVANLANKIGVRPDSKLGELQPKLGQFAEAIAQNEGYSQGNQPQNQQTQTASANQPTQQKEGLLSSLFRGITAPVVTMVARPFQAGAELLGATPEEVNAVSSKIPFYGQNGALNVPQTGSDLLKDVGRAAETVSLGLPVKGFGQAVGAGAVMGAGAGLENEPTLGGAVKGGLLGSALGAVGGGISKALESLPKSLTESAFKGLNPAQIEQTLKTKTIGTKASLLSQSKNSIKSLGNQLGSILGSPEYQNVKLNASQVLNEVAANPQTKQALLDTGLHLDEIAQKIKSIVPLKANLVDQFFNEGLSLPELGRLNSELGNKIFKSVFDEPAVRAGKELGSILYHGTSDVIKSVAQESVPIYNQLSKEYGVRTALTKIVNKSSGGLIRWSDILPFMGGSAVGGPLGGLGGIVAERIANNPAAQFTAAKTIQGAGKIISPVSSRAGLLSSSLKKK